MKLSWKSGVALVIAGIGLGGMLSAAAADNDPNAPGNAGPRGKHVAFAMAGPVVRGTAIVEGDNGTFKTVKTDSGELMKIAGNVLTVKEADGQSVDITVSDATDYGRNGESAKMSDLKVGDHVFVHRVDDVTEHVMAMDAQRYQEMEAQRAACEDNDQSTTCERPKMTFRGPGRDGPGAPPEAGTTEIAPGPAGGAVFEAPVADAA